MKQLLISLLALALMLIGIAILLYLPGRHLRNYYEVQSWVSVDAYVLSAKVHSELGRLPPPRHHGKKVSPRTKSNEKGKKVLMYRPEGQFRYDYMDKPYTSSDLSLKKGLSSYPEFAQNLIAQLQAAQRNNTPVTAYVNPDNPREAVIDRTIDWGVSAVGAVFGSIFVIGPMVFWVVAIRD